MRIIVGTILALLLTTTAYGQQNAVDRCAAVRDCICRVEPGQKIDEKTTEYNFERRSSTYFIEDGDTISAYQAAALEKFFKTLPAGRQHVTVIGYADGCGSAEYNKSLSARRAVAVSAIARKALKNVKIDIISGGERSAGHSSDVRRVDVVAHTSSQLTTKIDKVPADYYLIDASGSMWSNGWTKWSDVVNASVKPGSKIYLSIMSGCRNGQSISSIRPQGGTEIWWSYWVLLDKMKPGQTLAIISDLESNVPLTHREARLIEAKTKKAGVSVFYIRP